ncbi:helix-turn-helix domain-containing protein [Streptomyces sp. NPDC057596]|uniref:helix-turn-helix domain-containing protein n=1 Tax=unclassified Streptomyces TaxID=2593676 RepID=UPI003433A33F
MSTLTTWAADQPLLAAAASTLALAVLALLLRPLRRTPAAVGVASLAAMACTAYSADTSWRFAEHRLDMASAAERGAMFAAAELALFACALMARQNLRTQGAPGTPGMLVWVITGVQVIPAYSESGIVGGTVRAVVGPVLAALLWHLAMGIELRHAKPGTASGSLPALLARELRERLLSYLGLATRDRTAEQITRDRWTVKAVALAARLADMKSGERGRARVARRLSVAVGKAQAGASEEQRAKLLDLLAARRHAASLATIDLASPWQTVTAVTVPPVEDAQDTEDAPASPSVPPYPNPVPPGARLLPIVARPVPAAPTAQDAPEDDEDAQDVPPPEPPLMTSNDVADHYGIQPSTVRSWVHAGRIPVHSKDARGHNLFHPNDLPHFHVGVPV